VFGNRTERVAELRGEGYRPRDYYENNFDLKYAIDRLSEGEFSPEEPQRYGDIVTALLESDHYQLLADYADYVAAQDRVDDLYRNPAAWTRSAILNVAGMGAFSSDRTIREYATEIWGVEPVPVH
jgi:starch phosphorylase